MRNVKSRLPPTEGCTNQCKYSEVKTEVHIRTPHMHTDATYVFTTVVNKQVRHDLQSAQHLNKEP